MKPKVSICCIVFNHREYIRECIEGFLAQETDFDFEILIHDDASTDGTSDILKEYAQKHPEKIKLVIQEVNQFLVKNTLIEILFKMAQGAFIALCEGDDYWCSATKLQMQVDLLENNPECVGSYHDTLVVYKDGLRKPHSLRSTLLPFMTAEDTFSALSPFHTSSFVFRNHLPGFSTLSYNVKSGDMALFSMIAKHGKLIKAEGTLSVYRKHNSGITSSFEYLDSYNQDRIALMHFLDAYHGYKYHEKALAIIALHQNELDKNKQAQKGREGLSYRIANKVFQELKSLFNA